MLSNDKVVFKDYDSKQLLLLPPSLEELIPSSHPSRVVNDVIENIDLHLLIDKYKGGGTSSYHPKLLLKLLVYGYLSNVYSSRKLALMCKEQVPMMWLCGMSCPDHNTINRFRSERLKGVLKEVFSQVVLLLSESGHLDLKEAYTDGTKIEANANKYTFVWGNSIKTNKEKMVKQLEDLWTYSQSVAKSEPGVSEALDLSDITAEKVERTLQVIEENLTSKPVIDKKKKQKLNYAKREWANKLRTYKKQEEILENRNSYSKTDHDATFMRMKDDHMQNGQLKAGYNLQISTNKQFILHYTLHQKPSDSTTLIPHLRSFKTYLKALPDILTADAGYGSHENYEYLKEQEVEAYVKYNYFHKEQKEENKKRNKKDNLKDVSKLHYNKEKDEYICPMGQSMKRIGTSTKETENGYEQKAAIYQAKDCTKCSLRASCHKSKDNRRIQVNHDLNQLKTKAKERLLSEKGIKHRKQRCADVEAAFGNLKQNKGFKRFTLRGLEKVEIETGLMALAHNLAKVA